MKSSEKKLKLTITTEIALTDLKDKDSEESTGALIPWWSGGSSDQKTGKMAEAKLIKI